MQNTTENNIIGPDLNEYRGDVDYIKVATQTPYCYLRGSGNGSGRFRIDKKFFEYVRGLDEVGIKTGAYHYAVPSADLTTADAQCDGFIEVLQQAYGVGRYGDLFPVIDVEAPLDRSISTNTLLDWVDRFRKRFEQKTRRRLMLYTGAFFIDLYDNFYHTQKGFILADMPLWIAMYPEIQPNPDYPRDQGGWTRWRVWQFTENGYMPGINPPVDLNYGPENLDLLTQPENVRNFRAVAVDREIRVTWTPNTDIDLAGYNIFINSNYVTTVGKNANSYVLRLAEARPGERYEMAIEAFDTDGEFSQERSIAYATFGRGIDVNDEESDDYQLEDRWNIDTEIEPAHQSNIESQLVEFSDPVDNLAKRFIESAKINENINLYDDFVETNDEFDDILYMKRLEDENVYKKYYGDREYKSELEFCETGEDFRLEDDYKKLMGKSIYTCPNCIEYHEGHQDHEEYRSEQCDHNDKEHENHMKLETDKCSCEKHDRDYENYLDSEEYRSEQRDQKNKENEHHMKSEAGENKGHEEQHKEHHDQKDKENEHHMESEAAGNKGHEEQYKEHHDQKGKENEYHMESEAADNKGHEEQYKEHHDQKGKENEHHMKSEADENKGHEEQHKEYHDQKGKENEHHMKSKACKCPCENHCRDYGNYLDSKEYDSEQRDHKSKENEHHMKPEADKCLYEKDNKGHEEHHEKYHGDHEEHHKEHHDYKGKENEHHMKPEASKGLYEKGNKGHEEHHEKYHHDHEEHHDYKGKENEHHMKPEAGKGLYEKDNKGHEEHHEKYHYDHEEHHDYKGKENEHHMKPEADKCLYEKDNKGHEEHHKEHHDYKGKENEHHMELEFNKYPWKKHDRDYENYLDCEEYRSEYHDDKDKDYGHHMELEFNKYPCEKYDIGYDCYYNHREDEEYHVKPEFNKYPWEEYNNEYHEKYRFDYGEYNSDHHDYMDKEHGHHMELESNKYPCEKYDIGYDCYYNHKEDEEHHVKPEFNKYPWEEYNKDNNEYHKKYRFDYGEYNSDHHDYMDKEHGHHMELEFNRYPCEKYDIGYDCYYNHKEDEEHHVKPEFNKYPWEEYNKDNNERHEEYYYDSGKYNSDHHDYMDKEYGHHVELEPNRYPWQKHDRDYGNYLDYEEYHSEYHDNRDKEHGHHMELEFNKYPCEKYNKDEDDKKYYDKPDIMNQWDNNLIKCKCDREEENQGITLKEELGEDYKVYESKPYYDEIIREREEDDSRRLENLNSNKYSMCEECVQPKNDCGKCEYLLQGIYLNNCDYGHKTHKKKHYDYEECDEYHSSKKKKKKHHKKHHR